MHAVLLVALLLALLAAAQVPTLPAQLIGYRKGVVRLLWALKMSPHLCAQEAEPIVNLLLDVPQARVVLETEEASFMGANCTGANSTAVSNAIMVLAAQQRCVRLVTDGTLCWYRNATLSLWNPCAVVADWQALLAHGALGRSGRYPAAPCSGSVWTAASGAGGEASVCFEDGQLAWYESWPAALHVPFVKVRAGPVDPQAFHFEGCPCRQ